MSEVAESPSTPAPARAFPLGTAVAEEGPQREAYEARVAYHRRLVDGLAQQAAEVRRGGGDRAVAREHKRGKLTARERVAALLDDGSDFREIGLFAGRGMYEDEGGCPAGGTVMGLGRVSGRLCMVVANDATVKAGAWFPITAKKNLRAQEIALENRVPIVYLVDSAGVFLPMQDEIFPDKEHFGRIFRNNAKLSALGVPQIAAIMGSCVAGGAYLPIMSDESLIVDGTGSVFLAGPFLVQAAIGEETDAETLGGATSQTAISGVCDYKMPDDETALATIRDLVAGLGPAPRAGFTRQEPAAPAYPSDEVLGVFPESRQQPYDVRELLARVVDAESWTEVKADYGQTLVCGYARIDGWSVGVVASQRQVVRAKSPKGKPPEMQIGGVIYGDAADKAARFVLQCNQKRIPPGLFPGRDGVHGRDAGRAGRDHQGRGEAGQRRCQLGRPQVHRRRGQLVRGGQLRPLREGVRPAPHARLADGPDRRHGRGAGGQGPVEHRGAEALEAGPRTDGRRPRRPP